MAAEKSPARISQRLFAMNCSKKEVEMKILLVAINAKYIHSNLAVYCLKKYSKEYDNNIEIAEYTINQQMEFILQDIYKRNADVVAFSCYIWNIEYVTAIIKDLKKIMKNNDIWVGGPEVSYRATSFLEEYKEVKGVMVGEGEKSFNRLTKEYVEDTKDFSNIKGVVYRDGEELKATPCEELLDLSDVPFPYDDLDKFKNKIIYYESSRGCPYSCSYCLSSIDKKLRFRNLELVKSELKIFIDHKIPQVKFVDRTFNCNKKHAMEIWRFINENDNGVTNFHFEISADIIDEEELALFKTMRPGLIQLEIGVQTTNPVTIKEIDRIMNLDKLRYVVEKINSFNNIHQHLDLIAGLPYEDYNSFVKSFNDVYAMRPEQLQLGFLKVLSGAKMERKSEEYGLVYTTLPPYEVLTTKWLDYDRVLELKTIENMVEIYYNSRQFTNALAWLENQFETPFKMFEGIGKYYELHKLNEVKHNRIQMYEILLEYVKSVCEDYKVFEELLKLDVYLRENIKSRPAFAGNNHKEELRDYYHEYRSEGKNIHIELFNINIRKWINNRTIEQTGQVVMFDYREKDPITLWCRLNYLTDKTI